MRARVSGFVRGRVWPRRGVAGALTWSGLRLLSVGFGLGVRARWGAYRLGILHATRVDVPVVSVGNLAVGGVGKTPFTLWLAQALKRRGWRPAIVSHGYGAALRQATVCARGGVLLVRVEEAGDEAAMLGKLFSGVVITARRRAEGAQLARAEGCDVVLLDDGFQHLGLARDCDVVLVNRWRGTLLPSGPFREPPAALRRAHVVVQIRKDSGAEPAPLTSAKAPVFAARLVPSALVASVGGQWREHPLKLLAGRRVATVTGIADAGAFHDALRQWQAEIVEIIALDDHHVYTAADWRRIAQWTRAADLVITTEKDLVKLEMFPFAVGRLLALRIAPDVERAEELLDVVCACAGSDREGGGYGNQSGAA